MHLGKKPQQDSADSCYRNRMRFILLSGPGKNREGQGWTSCERFLFLRRLTGPASREQRRPKKEHLLKRPALRACPAVPGAPRRPPCPRGGPAGFGRQGFARSPETLSGPVRPGCARRWRAPGGLARLRGGRTDPARPGASGPRNGLAQPLLFSRGPSLQDVVILPDAKPHR